MTCAVNPTAYLEDGYRIQKTLETKKVAVIGGGIAGMEAARTARLRGFEVTLYEKSPSLGGILSLTSKQYHKQEIGDLVSWYERELKRLSVSVRTSCSVSADELIDNGTEIAIIAAGGREKKPELSNPDVSNFMTVLDYIRAGMPAVASAVVIGGGISGCETAVDLASRGTSVTLLEAAEDILVNSKMLPIMVEQMLRDLLDHYGVRVMTATELKSVGKNRLHVVQNGVEEDLETDLMLTAVGTELSPLSLETELRDSGIEVFPVGDYANPGNIYSSVHSAFEIARNL